MQYGERVDLYIIFVVLLAVFDELIDLRFFDLIWLFGVSNRQLKIKNVTLKYRVSTLSLHHRFAKLIFANVEVMYANRCQRLGL